MHWYEPTQTFFRKVHVRMIAKPSLGPHRAMARNHPRKTSSYTSAGNQLI